MNWHPYKVTALYCRVDSGQHSAMSAACAQNQQKRLAYYAKEHGLTNLQIFSDCGYNGDPVNRLPGNVNFCFEGIEGESLLLLLDDKGICASSGSACTSGSLDPSHVLLAIGRPHEVAHGSLRLSLSEWNTEEEVDYMLTAIPEVVDYLRSMSPVWQDLVSGKRSFMLP